MLEFLQTGKALSVLAAIGIIGIVSKLITRSLYRRLLKETDNMAMTKNKNLKLLKQKLENAYRLNQNIVNTQAYLDKQLYGFKFMHISLDTWNNLSLQMIILGLLAGGAGSFMSYWYRLDSYYIVLYASVAALGGLLLAFMDSSFNIPQKQQKLETVLLEYVDNSVFVRAARENSGRDLAAAARIPSVAQERERLTRENDIRDGLVREEEPRRLSTRNIKSRNSKAEDLLRTVRNMKEEEERSEVERESAGERPSFERSLSDKKSSGREGGFLRKRETDRREGGGAFSQAGGDGCDPDSSIRRDIDYLKHSLDQIAASKEKGRDEKDWTKNLSGEELKLIGEIMRQYFSEA